MPHKKSNVVSHILTNTFYPFPTVKGVQKNPEKKIIYDAAHHMFRNYPLCKPLLIYKHQFEQLCYDFYIERTENGWNDMVYTHPVSCKDNKMIYIIDGLLYAIKEEKEMKPLLLHMKQQVDITCRLLNL
jgi:hypothetical protein